MSLDLPSFAAKVTRLREMFGESVEDLAGATGVPAPILRELEAGGREPTGDQILILADHFDCDFRFFVSNEGDAPIERAEKLFRAYDKELSFADRRRIQEFLFLCENEAFLLADLDRPQPVQFRAEKQGTFYKGHGQAAAERLRVTLGCDVREVPDVFSDLRRLGIHVFRRRLESTAISGLFMAHPSAGPCVLVNYDEDFYRQRFTAAHETAHALFDQGDEYVVSFSRHDLREIRADAFAGAYLVPPQMVAMLRDSAWTEERLLDLADQLRVNVKVLTIALQRDGRMSAESAKSFDHLRLPRHAKEDPELPESLSPNSRARKRILLERGLSSFYAELCFEAHSRERISSARLAELLLTDESELRDIGALFGIAGA